MGLHTRHLILYCACLYLLGNANAIAAADGANTGVPLVLIVENNAHAPDGVLDDAAKHVVQIYRKAGIDIVWRLKGNLPAANESLPQALHLTIVLVPECISEETCRDGITGKAVGSEGNGARRAYVFWKRVLAEATILKNEMPVANPEALMLGHAIAHESGHLLLPPGHAKYGLMAAHMDASAVQSAIRGKLLFLPQEAETMRRVLTSH